MSDYGDDYSDNGEEWFYVEDEYMATSFDSMTEEEKTQHMISICTISEVSM